MVILTQSLSTWLFKKYPKILPLIMFGHIELLTPEMWGEYIAWCKTEEGRQYLYYKSMNSGGLTVLQPGEG